MGTCSAARAEIEAAQNVDSPLIARLQATENLRKLAGLKNLDADVGRVYDLERQADTLSRAALARLFRDGTEALEVIKWRDLYHELENAIDSAEDAAEAIERMFQKAT